MTASEILKEKREDILRIAAKHGARNVRVFGSVARGEAGPGSDIDLLVEVDPVHSSWFPAGLVLELEDVLGVKVHVVTEAAIHHLLKERIVQEAVSL